MAAVKRVQRCMKEAIWAVQNFVMDDTGKRATQEEIAMQCGRFWF